MPRSSAICSGWLPASERAVMTRSSSTVSLRRGDLLRSSEDLVDAVHVRYERDDLCRGDARAVADLLHEAAGFAPEFGFDGAAFGVGDDGGELGE